MRETTSQANSTTDDSTHPSRIMPVSASGASDMSRFIRSYASSISRACASKRMPRSVSVRQRPVRSKSGEPTSSSSSAIRRLSADCDMCSCSAARVMLPVRLTARKAFSTRKFMVLDWRGTAQGRKSRRISSLSYCQAFRASASDALRNSRSRSESPPSRRVGVVAARRKTSFLPKITAPRLARVMPV